MNRFQPKKLERAWAMLDRWVAEDRCPAVAAVVGSSQGASEPHVAGRLRAAPASGPLKNDSIFLIASPTKPVTALAAMHLVEQGEIRLSDPIARYIPTFAGGDRSIRVAHCLTHTSGLPDMVPENAQLRAAEAPLSEFLDCTCRVTPDFPAGTAVQYQSMGFLLLGEVVHQVTGKRLGEYLRDWLFQPLSMDDTVLGMPPDWEKAAANGAKQDRIAEVRLPPQPDGHSNCWNTAYWRRLGVPWGGLLASAGDLGRLCQHLLELHAGQEGVLSSAALHAMTVNQLTAMPDVPEADRRCHPWGLGWRLNWPAHASTFGDLLSPAAYGHWGATGTMLWIDPARDAFAVVLTTQPLDGDHGRMAHFSNAVCAALGDHAHVEHRGA